MMHNRTKNSGIFRDRSARFVWEGVIRATLCGLAVGFFVDFAVALATYAAGVNGLLASILSGVGAMAVSAPLFYFTLFRPRDEMMARRLDATGLDERLITMLEFRNSDSEMAGLQRRDAMKFLRKANPKRVPLRIVRFVVLAAVLAVFGTAMTAISTSAANGYFPTIDEIKKPGEEDPDDPGTDPDDPKDPTKELQTYFTITYLVSDGATEEMPMDPNATAAPNPIGGHIEWEASQLVIPGGDGVVVTAVADEGWAFQYWLEDESDNPTRQETAVTCDQTWTAVFVMTQEQDGGGGGGGEGEEDESQSSSSSSDSSSGDPNDNGVSGSYNPNNQIIDGETDYRQVCDNDYFSDVKDGLGGEDGSDDGSGGFADIYFDIIG